MIVITGASGHVGGMVARAVAARGHGVRLMVRDPARAPAIDGAEVVIAEYGDPAALARALRPGDHVFMVSLHEGPERRVPLHQAFVDAAAANQVAHIVYLSFLCAGPTAKFIHARSHGATEAMLAASGVPWTAVRNGMYADDIPGWFDPDGVLREPGGDGKLSFSLRSELADAIAVTLTSPGQQGKIYDVVGEPVSLAELAQIASRVTGRDYRYQPTDDADWDARWRADGGSGWQLEAGRTSYEALRVGELAVISDDYRTLTGREPATVAAIVERLRGELPLR